VVLLLKKKIYYYHYNIDITYFTAYSNLNIFLTPCVDYKLEQNYTWYIILCELQV
jgi:hypothetical protein